MIGVAVKFCGGCDPAYERLEYFERIKSAAGNRIRWVTIEEGGFEAILLISGCLKACPEEQMPDCVPVVSLKTDGADPRCVVDMLVEKGERSDEDPYQGGLHSEPQGAKTRHLL